MIIEISLAVIAVTFLGLVTVLVIGAVKLKKTLQPMQENMRSLTVEVNILIFKLNELVSDVSNKSKQLNFIFNSLDGFNKEDGKDANFSQLITWLKTSLNLFNKTKEFIKHYVK